MDYETMLELLSEHFGNDVLEFFNCGYWEDYYYTREDFKKAISDFINDKINGDNE